MKTRFNQWLMAMFGSLMAMLGFSSCDEQALMYGMPYSEFDLKGKVVDETGAPVENAAITMKGAYNSSGVIYVQKDYEPVYMKPVVTDKDGNYEIKNDMTYGRVRVICTPDGTSELAADSTDIEVEYTPAKNDGWCVGSYSGTVDFRLKQKSEPK